MGVTQRLGTIPLAIQTDSSNNVGIGGAANASYKLAVTGASLFTSGLTATANTSGAFAGLTLANSGTGSAQVFLNNSAQSWIVNLRTDNHFSIYNNTAATTPFFINTNGNVGIGTSSPSSTLQVSRGGAIFQLTDTNKTNNNTFSIYGFTQTSWAIATGNSGTFSGGEKIIITDSGNVGIGTSSIANGTAFGGGGQVNRLKVESGNYTCLEINGSTSGGSIQFTYGTNLPNQVGGLIGYNYASGGDMGMYISNKLNGGMAFATNDTERMRILSNGAVCIGRTSGDGKLNIDGTIYLYNTSAGAGNSTLKYNTSTGQVTFDSSARIYKKDITDLEYGLDSVLKMSSKKYKWKSNDANDLGFIADEMYQVVPEVVYLADNSINKTELEDGEPMGINYDRLVPVLVKAIQELSAKVTALENK